jgi:PAS domain S-box-containing protein
MTELLPGSGLDDTSAGFGAFEFDLATKTWTMAREAAALFGLDPAFADWEAPIFGDDLLKLHAALETAARTGEFSTEIRVRRADGLRWLAGKGKAAGSGHVRGAWFDITDRKTLEVRLLAMTETLEARVADVREEARILEILNRTGVAVAAELDLERLMQIVTDAGAEMIDARFAEFFYNSIDDTGEGSTRRTLSGTSREALSGFPMRQAFASAFHGERVVRSNDILNDPRYRDPRDGHPPVRSYLAVPIVARSNEVLGGLFFGHDASGMFTERSERLIAGIAAQAAVAIDNARLYEQTRRELESRKRAERELQILNDTLEQRVEERAREVEQTFSELHESERRFRLLVEAVTDYAIFMLDPDGHVVKWNPGVERLKGYLAHEIIGQHFSVFYTEEDLRDGVPENVLATAIRTGKYEGEGWRVRKDGVLFWAHVVVHPMRDQMGQLIGFAKVTRDLTEKRAADEQLRQVQKMEAIGQLTGGVAHDFNNLLTVISGNMEGLQRRLTERGEPSLLRYVDSALRGSERAALLTHQLLAFSRRQPLQPTPVSVNALITNLSEMLRRTIAESVAIETVLAGGVWQAFIDVNQLENCLLNLAVNARDAMPDGGKLTIEAANVYLDESYVADADIPAGQYVGIFVSDTGTGMTADVISRAFDPFFTTKDIGQGTGLGLSQVYGFVKQSGGHVKIYSEVGAGTTIRLYLPRLLAPDGASEKRPEAQSVPTGEGETILVVEDEPDVRGFAVEMLRELGYHVLDAPDGHAGLRVLDANREIVLLLTDVGLPGGMNGRQLAEEALRRRPRLKVLFTSGYARNAIIHHGRLDPGVQFIAKPFTFTGLATKLRQVLEGR